MRKRDWRYRETVQESTLDSVFDYVEEAINRILTDQGLYGVFAGLSVTEDSPTGLDVVVSTGTARDQDGNRIRVPSPQTVDCSVDYLGASTTVSTVGQGKWLSLYLVFDRDLQDPQTDGNGDNVYVDIVPAYAWKVVQGAEAALPSKPALLSDAILLCDIALSYGQTAIVTANFDTDRRMVPFKKSGAPLAINAVSLDAVLTQILGVINPHITGAGQNHGAGDIGYNGSPSFADGVTNIGNSGTVEDAIDALVTLLAEKASTPAGDDLIGVRQDATQSPTLSAGTLRERLAALRIAANLAYAGSPNFADSTSISAGTVEAAIDAIVTALTSTSGNRGAGKITAPAVSQSPTSLSADTIAAQIAALLTAINARALAAYTPSGNISSTTVHTAIAELDTEKAALAGATFTGEVRMPRVNVGAQNVGVIAADVQITNDVGSVFVQSPASDTVNYCLAMPVPAAGNPVLHLKFYGGGVGSSRRVWITTTAEIGAPPSNYFAYWEANTNARAGATFAWDGTRWRHIVSTGLTGTAGGGTLSD